MVRRLPLFVFIFLFTASFAAQAEMAVYGEARVAVDYLKNNDPDGANEDKTVSVSGSRTWLGFRGEESVRETMSVIWRAEKYLSLDDGGWGNGRNAYLGLNGKMGTILAGKYATPYRLTSDQMDVFQDTRADFHAVVGSIDGESVFGNRMKNMLFYKTPQIKQFEFSLALSPGYTGDDSLPLDKDDSKKYAFSTALAFDNGPLLLGFSYSFLKDFVSAQPTYTAAASGNATARKINLGWDFGGGTTVGLILEDAKNGARIGSEAVARKAYYLNFAHIAGNTTWKAAYGRLEDLDALKDSSANHYALGFSYALSPKADLFGLFTLMQNGDNASYGLNADSDDSDPVGASIGEDVMALSFGLVYRFDRAI